MGWRKGGRLAVVLAWTLLGTGCASAIATHVPKAGSESACVRPVSRAALFGAAGLEALARVRAPGGGSVLEQVNYLSSVSGGSLAASYYASQKPPRETAVLAPDGSRSGDYQAFFARYKDLLTQDFESWVNSALAARSLFEILEERLLGGFTFGDLGRRETRGDSPYLIVNTTLYNNGRRFTLTTLPAEASRYDFFDTLRASLAKAGKPTEIPPPLTERWKTLLPVTPLEIGLDPCPVRLAAAVTGSASFPPLVGPITFRVGDEDLYWHTGDGGLYENQGIESLLFVFLKQLQEGQARQCDRQLLEVAAAKVVAQRRQELLELLESPTPSRVVR